MRPGDEHEVEHEKAGEHAIPEYRPIAAYRPPRNGRSTRPENDEEDDVDEKRRRVQEEEARERLRVAGADDEPAGERSEAEADVRRDTLLRECDVA